MDELLNDFITETAEHIESAGIQIVLFENNPTDASLIASIFRLFHTIKGTCGFLGLSRMMKISHAAETLIGKLREGAPAEEDTVSLILAAIDRIKMIIEHLEKSGIEPSGNDDDLIELLEIRSGNSTKENKKEIEIDEPQNDSHISNNVNVVNENTASAKRNETIRVNLNAIERIMQLVSELVLTRNQLVEITGQKSEENIKAPLQRLSSLTTDLQDAVMRARMQPVERIFASLPRLVRELSTELGKKINLVTEGADTELDRQLIELIRDPLTHMIRNSADHGIESPAERIKNGKAEIGTIKVSATHEAGQITIDIVDDGKGLDSKRIREKALALNLVNESELQNMSDEECHRFIFAPGFSTAQKVTNVSGRGVGMDVVRENLNAIGGAITLSSSQGRGSRFSMKIPLTLAIAPALIVEVNNNRFALPQHSVVEAVSLDKDHKVEKVQRSMVLRLREQVLPVGSLSELLGINNENKEDIEPMVVVMRVGQHTFGILVDCVADVQEIVVKPLGSSLSHLTAFSGHTILGDGSVVLILDPGGLSQSLGLEQSSDTEIEKNNEQIQTRYENKRLLMFRAGEGAIKIVPLSLISRIETVPKENIKMADGNLLTEHQGKLINVVLAENNMSFDKHSYPILIVTHENQTIGIIVDEIVDIVDHQIDIQIKGQSGNILGTAQIRNDAVELIDLSYYMSLIKSKPQQNEINILLIHDKIFFQDLLIPILALSGITTYVVDTIEKGIGIIEEKNNINIIISSLELENKEAFALSSYLHNKDQYKDIPLIGLCSNPDQATISYAQIHGFHSIIGHFDRYNLIRIIEDLISHNSTINEKIGVAA